MIQKNKVEFFLPYFFILTIGYAKTIKPIIGIKIAMA